MPLTFDSAGDVLSGGLDLGQAGSARHAAGDANSPMRCKPSSLRRADQTFAFPGLDGVFTVGQGTRGRTILWTGSIRATDDTRLNAIEADIDTYIVDGAEHTMIDVRGRTWPNVRIVEYRADQEAGRIDAAGTWTRIQDFVMVFEQNRR